MLKPHEILDEKQIVSYIKKTGVKNVTLTGGEPLIQEGIRTLIEALAQVKNIRVEIETNGSVPVSQFFDIENRPSFTIDYKLPGSGMEKNMYMMNYRHADLNDTVKFVVCDEADLEKMKQVIEKFELRSRTNVYISPVYGKIQPDRIVDFIKENNFNDVNLQLQLHKIIWDPSKRGV